MEVYVKVRGDSYLYVAEVEKLKSKSSSLCRLSAKNSDSREYMTAVKLIRLKKRTLRLSAYIHTKREER